MKKIALFTLLFFSTLNMLAKRRPETPITVKTGEEFTVKIDEEGDWNLRHDEKKVEFTKYTKSQSFTPDSQMSQQVEFSFKAISPGNLTLYFDRILPWRSKEDQPSAGMIQQPVIIKGEEIPAPVKKGIPEDKKTRTVKTGEKFTIKLASNPTTGYSWRLVSHSLTKLKLIKDKEFIREKPPIPGLGGYDTFVFQALEPGTPTIILEYAQPWEKDKPAAKRHLIEVVIE